METSVVLLITSLSSALIGFLGFATRAALKSNCVYLRCCMGCCECRRQPTQDIEQLELSPPPTVEFENPVYRQDNKNDEI